MRRYAQLLACLFFAWALPAAAVIETYDFTDPALEQRYQSLSNELRCPKCQNQNIADSNAPIAQDLRKQLFVQLEAGASDDEIRQYMVDRYGEFVRYRPSFSGATAVLWLAPAILLALAALIAWLTLRRRGGQAVAPKQALDAQDRERLSSLLGDGDERQ
nr:cytochrome c-type biogenesis protein [Haliea sp. SAOS-164]